MSNYKIESIGWKSRYNRNSTRDFITFYALVNEVGNPDFQFSLKMSLFEVLRHTYHYHNAIKKIYDGYINDPSYSRDDTTNMEDLNFYYIDEYQMALMAFDAHFDLDEEAKKAALSSPKDLSKLKKIVKPVDRSKPILMRKGAIYAELEKIFPEALFNSLIKAYPILNSIKDFKEKMTHNYFHMEFGFFEDWLIDFIYDEEEKIRIQPLEFEK